MAENEDELLFEEDQVEIKTEPEIEEIVNTNQVTGPFFYIKTLGPKMWGPKPVLLEISTKPWQIRYIN